jgi:hypothetical protein
MHSCILDILNLFNELRNTDKSHLIIFFRAQNVIEKAEYFSVGMIQLFSKEHHSLLFNPLSLRVIHATLTLLEWTRILAI